MYFSDGQIGTYAVRVFATNYAAMVWPNDTVFTSPFYSEVPSHLVAGSWNATLDFSFTFGASDYRYFNVAETIRIGRDYANARRDPREAGETIPQLNVLPTYATGSAYDFNYDILMINGSQMTEDFLILHEYAHFLEANIGGYAPMNFVHDGCTVTSGGVIVNSPEHAWMEGFADYFARAVELTVPGKLWGTPNLGTPSVAVLETPPACNISNGDAVEFRVAALLWDLVDQPTDSGSISEPLDHAAREDVAIFQIFDHELDQFDSWPTITSFHDAWRDRGLDHDGFDKMARGLGMSNAFPQFETNRFIETQQEVVQNADGRLEIFARGPDDALWHKYQTSTKGLWSQWQSLGGSITARPAAILGADGRINVFVRGSDYRLYLVQQTAPGGAYSGFAGMGPERIMSAPAVGLSANTMNVFVRGTDDMVYRKRVNMIGESAAWQLLYGIVTSGLSVVTTPDGLLQLFARGGNNDLQFASQTSFGSSVFTDFVSLGGFLQSSPSVAVNTDGRMEVFALGPDFDTVYSIAQLGPGGSWSDWTSLSSPPGASVNTPAVILDAAGRLSVFTTNTSDGTAYVRSQIAPGSATYQNWQSLGGSVMYPTVAKDASGAMWVFGEGPDSQLYSINQTKVNSNPRWATGWSPMSAPGGGFFRF
jgi:hypothetical protein